MASMAIEPSALTASQSLGPPDPFWASSPRTIVSEPMSRPSWHCVARRSRSRGLVVDFPHDEGMRVSHETIYTWLFVQTRPGLRADLWGKLRTRRVRRHSKRRVAFSAEWSRIPDLVSMSERSKPSTAKHPAIGKAAWWRDSTFFGLSWIDLMRVDSFSEPSLDLSRPRRRRYVLPVCRFCADDTTITLR